jgi:ribonucleoside-diphosphate reductase alpha chain
MFMAIAMFLAQREENRQEWAIKFYNMISKFEVMLATPTLSNARTPRHQLSSCYIGSTPDNIEGIFDSYKEMALLSKFGGGIGWDWNQVRGMGGQIDGHKNAAGGIVPFLKITNDIAVAVDQLGTRKGAIAVYVEPWHIDIMDFLDLKKNSGEERRRAHDLFPALWINDLFMKRVGEDGLWTLFDPFDTPELSNLYSDKFEKKYIEYENDANIIKESIKAKELWKKILLSYFETGTPFLCFKDNANRVNPNSHEGVIRSSNLCTEIFQNTDANHYKIKVVFDDQSFALFEEDEDVLLDSGITKKAKKITALDQIKGKKIFIVEKEKYDGKTAVCNLASINLSKINKKEDFERVIPTAVRMLDNVIDLNFYPLLKVKKTNLETRSIGLGVMGEAQMLAEAGIKWGSYEHFIKIDETMEMVSYNAISASANLAIEKGKYPKFAGSKWSQGIFPIDGANEEVKKLTDRGGLFGYIYDWQKLKEKVKKSGMRNGYLMAVAPTSSISILVGTTQTIEPVYKRKWFEENLSGLIPVVAPNLSPDTWGFYTPAYELDQTLIVKAGAVRQKWIDQGQSLNIFITLDKASGKYLNEIYMLAWRLGVKSTYYLRSQSPEAVKEEEGIEDRSLECFGCQ